MKKKREMKKMCQIYRKSKNGKNIFGKCKQESIMQLAPLIDSRMSGVTGFETFEKLKKRNF